MLIKFKPVRKNGQSLVEVVIALAIAVLVISSIISTTTTGIKNSQFSRNHDLALKLSQEGMEWVRAKRDELTWTEFSGKAAVTSWCLPNPPVWDDLVMLSPSCPKYNIFIRSLELKTNESFCLATPPSDAVNAIVTVKWTDAAGEHKSQQSTCFTNWQKK